MGYMPEDRRIIPQLSVVENELLPSWAAGRKDGGRLTRIYRVVPEIVVMRHR
jgi:branched-chain amino acid transport system ATP-binding protein